MRNIDGQILLSATDLMRFAGCAHATALDLGYLRGRGPKPREDSADAALLQQHGTAHEESHIAGIKAAGRRVVEIPQDRLADDTEATRAALAEGVDIVFQGAFLSAFWGGWSDFLERVEAPSDLPCVDDRILGRRDAARHGLPAVAQPHQRRRIAGQGAGAGLRQPPAPRGEMRDGRVHAAGQHAVRVARPGGRRGKTTVRRRIQRRATEG